MPAPFCCASLHESNSFFCVLFPCWGHTHTYTFFSITIIIYRLCETIKVLLNNLAMEWLCGFHNNFSIKHNFSFIWKYFFFEESYLLHFILIVVHQMWYCNRLCKWLKITFHKVMLVFNFMNSIRRFFPTHTRPFSKWETLIENPLITR